MLGKTHKPRANHTREKHAQTNTHKYCTPWISSRFHKFLHLMCEDQFLPCLRSKNIGHIFCSTSPRSPGCCKGLGLCSCTLLPQTYHLIAFHWSCPIRCLMFIHFRRCLPSTSASPNQRSVSFSLHIKKTDTRRAIQQRIVFILCKKVPLREKKRTLLVCLLITCMQQYISWPVVSSNADQMRIFVFKYL